MTTELCLNPDGYLACPRRGEISADWCSGCPYCLAITDDGDGAVAVACVAEPSVPPGQLLAASPLRDVPEMWM